MGGDEYIIDENGAWSSPSKALDWYRQELKRFREAMLSARKQAEASEQPFYEMMKILNENTK